MFMNWFRIKYPYTDFHELNFDIFITEFKSFVEALSQIDSWIENHEKEYEELKSYYERLLQGDIPEELYNSIRRWINLNLQTIIGDAIKSVYFGLTNDGYFCAYIPASWSAIEFETIMDYDDPLYGHLVLKYD